MKNWKTTLGGILIAASPIILNSVDSKYAWILSNACTVLGGILLGHNAEDKKP